MPRMFTTTSQVLPFTTIHHSNSQEKDFVESCLRNIRSKENGLDLLAKLSSTLDRNRDITIKVVNEGDTYSKPYLNPIVLKRYKIPYDENNHVYGEILDLKIHNLRGSTRSRGDGASTFIQFNQNLSLDVDDCGIGTKVESRGYSFVNLAHELVHAYYTARGQRLRYNVYDPSVVLEEDRAIGVLDYIGIKPSENAIRYDHRLPLRSTHLKSDGIHRMISSEVDAFELTRPLSPELGEDMSSPSYSIDSVIKPFIKIHSHDYSFIEKVDTALLKLEKIASGESLLNKIRELTITGKKLHIYSGPLYQNLAIPQMSQSQIESYRLQRVQPHQLRAMAYELASKRKKHDKAPGTNVDVFYNPTRAVKPNHLGRPFVTLDPLDVHVFSHFTLGHVLIHAMRMMKGNYTGGYLEQYDPNQSFQRVEELRAVGIYPFNNKVISENKMREQSGLAKLEEIRDH